MPTMDEMYQALRNADAAGDTAAAQRLAAHIKTMQVAEAPAAAPAPKQKQFGEQLNDLISDAPRQAGLAARYAVEGVGNVADMVTAPIRVGLNSLGMNIQPGTGQVLANTARLPEPQNARERVVGDMSRAVAGGGGTMAAARGVAGLAGGVTQKVAQMMAANPAMQTVSGAAAGGAGGYTRETGGNAGSQLAASLAAGIATPFALAGGARLASGVQQAMAPRPIPSPQQIDITINSAMRGNGLTLDQMADDVAASIRADVAKALQTGEDLSPDAVRRLADYRLVDATPNRAGLTLDPAIVTQQRNLAKQGANSKDPVAQQLAQMERANDQTLTRGVNALGANTADNAYAGGAKVIGALEAKNARAQKIIGKLYDRARGSDGRSAELDPSAFTQRAGNLLHESNVESFLTPDIRNKLNGFASGEIPLTVEIAEQFKTNIGRLQRNSMDGNVRHALGLVRQALDETPLVGAQPAPVRGGGQLTVPGSQAGADQPALGQSAINAFDRARKINRQWMGKVEETPALEAVREGIEPDLFVQKYIIGKGGNSNYMDVNKLRNTIQKDPDAMQAVREQMAAHLKAKALNGAADETGNFSHSAYKKALDSIGDQKLGLFFSKEEVAQLRAISRVASYEQFQPRGAAVGNPNTAAALSGMIERILGSSVINKVPFGKQLIGDPLETIMLSSGAKKALDTPGSLTNGIRQPLPRGAKVGALAPSVLFGMETEEQRRRRQQMN